METLYCGSWLSVSRFTLSQAQSVSCHELLDVHGQSTLNSNRTKHKRRKKLANQKRRHMYFRQFCPIRTRYALYSLRSMAVLVGRAKSKASDGRETAERLGWEQRRSFSRDFRGFAAPAPGSTKPLCYTGYALYRRFRASATKAT